MTIWTPEAVDMLRKLRAENLSTSEIAARIGGIERNAVIGKAHRLKLGARAPRGNDRRRSPVVKVEPLPPERVADVVPLRVALVDLHAGDCRYPLGDPGEASFAFCGLPALEGRRPYCRGHAKICYQPLATRKVHPNRVA